MSDGTKSIDLSISYWTNAVGTFDPWKVVCRIKNRFPDTVIDRTDHQQVRLQRELAFWNSHEMPEERRQSLIRSSSCNARDNGPSYRVEIPFGLTQPVLGWARRYSVRFQVPAEAPDSVLDALETFLKSLDLGEARLSISKS
jgi:hypothetical protein